MSIENHVQLIGNLGDDPETRYTQAGMAVTTIRLATTSQRKDRDGNKVEETSWHRVKFFGRLAEIAGEYLRKGSTCSVQGSIRYSEHEKDGVKRYYTDFVADQLKMLGKPQDRGGERPQRSAPQRQAPAQPAGAGFEDDFSDDIPF